MIFIARLYKDTQSKSQLPYDMNLLLAEMPGGTQDIYRELAGVTQHSQKTCTVQGAVGHPTYLK